MQPTTILTIAFLLPALLAAPAPPPATDSASTVDAPVVPADPASTISSPPATPPTSTIPSEPTTQPTIYIEPPPIFDPPEPRPDTIFDAPRPAGGAGSILRPPPMPKNRLEHVMPFTGAMVHDYVSPYRPDNSDLVHCSLGMYVLRMALAITGLAIGVWAVVSTLERIWRGCVRVARRRRSTLSGSEEGQIRLDETLVEKAEAWDVNALAARSRSASKVLPV